MLARKVREKFGTIGDWYTIKGLPTDHDDDVEKVCLEILTMYRERRSSGYASRTQCARRGRWGARGAAGVASKWVPT